MGYDWSKGKSERAVEAEAGGLLVASKLAARVRKIGGRYRKCNAADISCALAASEWHHSSRFFNRVSYYQPLDLAQLENRRLRFTPTCVGNTLDYCPEIVLFASKKPSKSSNV